jgi:hypothetical protein
MAGSTMYHEGNRQLQDQFESRRIADRLESFVRTEFTTDDRAFIESASYFFLATADAEGRPDCSFKGGMPGFVSVTGPSELVFPDYDGNGMFQEPGQYSGKRRSRHAVHRHAWKAAALARQRHGDGQSRRSAAGADRRRATHGPCHRPIDLSELSALHPGHAVDRSFDLCAAIGMRSA